MNKLLKRQIKKYIEDSSAIPEQLVPLFEAISSAYDHFDEGNILTSRALDLSLQELMEVNARLKEEIVEREYAEEKTKSLQKQLYQAQKMESIGTMANGIAHNFNNILAAVRGYVDMVIMDVEQNSRMESDLKKVVKGIEAAKELSNKMLLFSREHEQKFERVEIYPIVKDAIDLFSASVRSDVEINE
ncbi:MAG: hypothetical protein KKF78_06405, partial [Candidatus Omnitrophica bacterium]|nr:hypothetical protein [Candidatus Omnitrophota bacterium]